MAIDRPFCHHAGALFFQDDLVNLCLWDDLHSEFFSQRHVRDQGSHLGIVFTHEAAKAAGNTILFGNGQRDHTVSKSLCRIPKQKVARVEKGFRTTVNIKQPLDFLACGAQLFNGPVDARLFGVGAIVQVKHLGIAIPVK